MQPNHESDELQPLLHEQYGAPHLDDRFSSELISRLQAEAASKPSAPHTRRSMTAISLGAAAVAAVLLVAAAVVWNSNQGSPETNKKMARQAKPESNRLAFRSERLARDGNHSDDHVEELSSITVMERKAGRTESESQVLPESLALVPKVPEANGNSTRTLALSQLTQLSVLPGDKLWQNVAAMTTLNEILYVVDSGRLYEVKPGDSTRRIVGSDDWRNTAAMGAVGERLYIISDGQLYEVDPATGVRARLGKFDWADTKGVATFGDQLYVACGGLIFRIHPADGLCEVLPTKNDETSGARKPNP